MNKEKLLQLEKNTVVLFWLSLLVLAITGVAGLVYQGHSDWALWSDLFHALAGLVFFSSLTLYLVLHFKRTFGVRRPLVFTLGVFAALLLLLVIFSGATMVVQGRQEQDQHWYLLHLVSTALLLLFLLFHVLAYYLAARQQGDARLFKSQDAQVGRQTVIGSAALVLLFVFCVAASGWYEPAYSDKPLVADYLYDYGAHPFRPSQTETYHNKFIDERQIVQSAQCGNCHQDITRQWIDSAHKKAASDPTYIKNISLLAERKGITATRYCEGCHAPVALLTGQLSPGGQHGGIVGTPGNREGVNCLSCHGLQSIEHVKGNGSYRFGQAKPYLFDGATNPALELLNQVSIRLDPAQHKKDMGKAFTRSSDLCATCHAQFMDKEMNKWGWVKMQDDYASWLAGPFSSQNPRFNQQTAVPCQGCHMPLVAGKDPSADGQGQIRSHRFLGANSLLALLNDSPEQFEQMVRFLQSNKMRLTIDKPNRQTASQNYKPLEGEVDARQLVTAPYFYYLNEQAELNIAVSNIGVGHHFPGGTIDINEAWLEIVVTDASGQQVFSSGLLHADQTVDPKAYFYRSMPVDRFGKDVWKHDLFNMVGDRYRNAVAPGASDLVQYQFQVPAWAVSPLHVAATLKYRKLNKKYTDWALDDSKVSLPVIDMARDSLQIPLKTQADTRVAQHP